MTTFHVNTQGEAGQCRATTGNCPFGDSSDHYSSAEEARSAYEQSMGNSFASDEEPKTDQVLALLHNSRNSFDFGGYEFDWMDSDDPDDWDAQVEWLEETIDELQDRHVELKEEFGEDYPTMFDKRRDEEGWTNLLEAVRVVGNRHGLLSR